jgi:L-seryl-tRNA(Ser) seleniumtransferase
VTGAVLKTVVAGHPGQAGSIPVRLRHDPSPPVTTADHWEGRVPDDPRRRTPRTDAVLADARLAEPADRLGRDRVRAAVRAVLERCRGGEVSPDDVVDAVLEALPAHATSLRPVVNATGVVVHTNLGRAPLSDAAVQALTVAAGHTDVELDLATGQRGPRGAGALAALAAAVPDAGGVHVVGNGAAALALATRALAADREVVVARGELVEIGDGFRIPELLESLGARLREVGTTNRVRLQDYADAVGGRTAFVLKVHPSNFRVAGLLAPHPRLPDEPDAASTLRAGAALVTASGDKLLGGPQCGLLLGEADLVQRLRRHPFARALRVDKLTLAALEATLTGPPPPVARSLAPDPERLLDRAVRMAAQLSDVPVEAVRSEATVGGGGGPGVLLASAALALAPHLAGPLRTGPLPVVGRLQGGRLLLDLVAVPEHLDDRVVECVRRAAGGGG